jgi:hypothetical protein
MHTQLQSPFTWRHFHATIILLCVRWYLRCALSYRTWRKCWWTEGCASIIRRSLVGFSSMPRNWSNDADPISKRPLTRGPRA